VFGGASGRRQVRSSKFQQGFGPNRATSCSGVNLSASGCKFTSHQKEVTLYFQGLAIGKADA